MIKEWLESYHPTDREKATSALREIMQQLALAGLYRAGFYEKAAFYGGTALRIFYGLDRFSEDLDFSILTDNPDFSFQPYIEAIVTEFNSQGMQVSIREKEKKMQSNIESAFLKSQTIWKELILDGILPQQGMGQVPNIKIKIEVDKQPPAGFATEEKLLTQPFSFYVRCFTLPSLFAGKMHALLFRKWQNNVKGRDWYDMEWYIKKGVPLNLSHFIQRAVASNDWKKNSLTSEEFLHLLNAKIDAVNMDRVKDDIRRFIPDENRIAIWSPKYFHDLVERLKIEDQNTPVSPS
ncbi:MAG: nucleotidyl transferase AbiEii/AbiGii toxin family protein [Bacteroidetes bacterium]|nr:nucleotidyl transferase AbiEii/AbiGii toxin family protein [Bacteroidota bacterium]